MTTTEEAAINEVMMKLIGQHGAMKAMSILGALNPIIAELSKLEGSEHPKESILALMDILTAVKAFAEKENA